MASTNYMFVVLTPNGRRETVRVTPNTSILQVLEDVCRKQQLNSNEWDLKHFNRIIELANSVRFSGLANNATLEMVQSSKPRVENIIRLGLQLESGKRLMHQFSPFQTLWEVLLHWDEQGETIFPKYSAAEEEIYTQPVCIYMRQEVVGKEQLQQKTLRSLGLTHGSACIRLIHRSESQLRHQANVSAPLSRQTTSQVQIPSDQGDEKDWGNTPNPQTELLAQAKEPPAHLQNPVPPVHDLREPSTVHHPEAAVSMKKEGNPNVNPSTPATISTPASSETQPSNRRKIAKDKELHILGEHDAILYYADDACRPTQSAESLPDSFFEVTAADVTMMWRDLQQKRIQLENAPLQTASARSLERDTIILRNLREHPVTIVRVRFSDRYVLQGKFRSMDTVAAVENFVKHYLAKPELTFHLFTTPPRTILQSSNRLVEEGLVGYAVIYFGSEERIDHFLKPEVYEKVSCPDAVQEYIRENAEHGNPKPPIDSTTLNSAAQQQQPSTSHGHGNTNASSSPGTSAAPSAGTSSANPRPTLNPGSSTVKGGKIPKWFKTGK